MGSRAAGQQVAVKGKEPASAWVALVLLAMVLTACTATSPAPAPRPAEQADTTSSRPKGTLRIAWRLEPDNLNPRFATGGGAGDFFWVFNSFLTYYDFNGALHPMLARQIPTQENGDWVVNADGTMRTTYRLREQARWHDGTPLTAHDFVLGWQVYMDRDLPVIERDPELRMTSVAAQDDHTLVITWGESYVLANALGYPALTPIPRHLSEEKYRANRANFTFGEEWTLAYVGIGPFRVERWSPGSGIIARAHADWALGAPKLDTLDIRFIPDAATVVSNLLAGEIDLTNSPTVAAGEAVIARDQWVSRNLGYLKIWATRLAYIEFQHREVPGWQPAVTDVRVRQALAHSIDRAALADTMTQGLDTAADLFMAKQDPLYADIERLTPKYGYDPNRAAALLASAGWQRAQPGQPLLGPAGQPFEVEVASQIRWEQSATIAADYWKAAGMSPSIVIVPTARERDREYRASFRATHVGERTIATENFYWVSTQIPTPESRWAELNRGSFHDPEVDRLQRVAITSLNPAERREATIALHRRAGELVVFIPLYHPPEAILAKNTVRGPVGNYGPQVGVAWNVFEWEIAE
jgi:peptide/nickel transport system substrate-binding protein